MKTQTPPTKSGPTFFNPVAGQQPVRVIKAAQAGKLLGGHAAGNGLHALSGPQHKPEIRLIHADAEYCDLEITCGCGESTKVRCWNTPAATAKAA